MSELPTLTSIDAQRIIDEAMALVDEGYTVHQDEVGSLRFPGRPGKRVDALVWLSVRSMVAGIGIAAARRNP